MPTTGTANRRSVSSTLTRRNLPDHGPAWAPHARNACVGRCEPIWYTPTDWTPGSTRRDRTEDLHVTCRAYRSPNRVHRLLRGDLSRCHRRAAGPDRRPRRSPRRRRGVVRPDLAGLARGAEPGLARHVGPRGRCSPDPPPPARRPAAPARPARPAEVALDPEDEVLVAGLQCLPIEHRLPLVLHYLGQCRSRRSPSGSATRPTSSRPGSTAGSTRWSRSSTGPTTRRATSSRRTATGDAYDWTAEALEDCAQRFRETFPVPPPALVFRRATVKKVTRRGAPITAAAAAAAIGLVAYLSPAPEHTAQAATYAAAPQPGDSRSAHPPSSTRRPLETTPRY